MADQNEIMLENTEEKVAEAPAKKENPRKRRRKRKKRVPVQLCLVLVIIALLFGVVLGYAVGRATGAARLAVAQDRIDELADAAAESGRQEIDVFTDSISTENRAALADLSGMSMQAAGEDNVFLGDDGFDTAPEAAASPEVVAEYAGGTLMRDEVSLEYNDRLSGYIFAGYSEDEIAADLLNEVMQDMILDRILAEKAKAMGVYEITAADAAKISAEAQAIYDEKIAQSLSFVAQEGMTAEQQTAAAAQFLLEAEGVDLETIRAEIESTWWMGKLRDEVVKHVQADDPEALEIARDAAFDQKKAEWLAEVNPKYYPERMQ